MNERDFQQQIIDLARLYRWMVMHQRPAMTARGWRTAIQGDAGFPDLVLVKDGWMLVLEVKMPKGKATQAQLDWIAALDAVAGVTARLVRPDDWDEIVALIQIKKAARVS